MKLVDEEIVTLPRAELEAIQLRRLQASVRQVYQKVAPYRAKMDQAGIKPGDIKSLGDLQKLPFTTKDDLRDNYPFGLFAVDMDDVVRVHASSGTTGKPTVVGYTKADISTWADIMARALSFAAVTRKDIVHNTYGYGLFSGGLGFHYGAERLGATVIPVSRGNTKSQITIMRDLGPTVLLSTPSYALNLAETIKDLGISLYDLKLRVGIHGAEPWSENMKQEVEQKLGIKALDLYGLSEVIGPGVAMQCLEADRGMHVFEDHFLPEIVDPDTFEPLPLGEPGELVFTTLTKEAFPIIRYRTRDISRLIPEKCRCGRSLIRMGKVTGRTDDMLIIRGVNVFPSQIEHVLMGIDGVEPHYQIELNREGSMDTMRVLAEASDSVFADDIRALERLTFRIQVEIKDLLGVSCTVKLVKPRTIQRSAEKAQRVIDKRKGRKI